MDFLSNYDTVKSNLLRIRTYNPDSLPRFVIDRRCDFVKLMKDAPDIIILPEIKMS